MIKSIHIPNKEFNTKEEMFSELKANVDFIIESKKTEIKNSCDKGLSVSCKSLDLMKFTDQLKGVKIDDDYYYIAVNTTGILDSHLDLHVSGIWSKTVKEQQGKNYLVEDHALELSKVIVAKEHVEMFTAKLPFSLLGKPYEGDTQALIYKVPKNKVKKEYIKEWLDSGDSIEASVRMQYVNIKFAMDSNDPEDAVEKKVYDDHIDQIANKGDYEYIPYFFVVKEAKNVKESSLVLFGSNNATGQIENKTVAVEDTTEIKEPSLDTQKNEELLKELLKKI